MVVQSAGYIVQYLYTGIWLHLQRYNFWEVCVVMMKLMWVWYNKYHDVHIGYISVWKLSAWYCMLFNVTYVFICTKYTEKVMSNFKKIVYVYVVWKHSYVSMYMCICTMTMIFHTVIYCISVTCSFSCFNTELPCAIVCNTCITCNIYHFDHKSQYVVQLSMFILETLLMDINTYFCIAASLCHM